MSAFKKHKRSGRCVATFSAFEADLIRSLAGQLIELLHSEEAIPRLEDAGLPDEPEEGLFIDVELDPATASAWLRALTDLRLAIGVRLEVEEDDEEFWEELEDDDPRGPMHEIYLWLGWVQETLISAVMK